MRCGVYSKKTAKKINFPALVQLKADGMFQCAVVENGEVTFNARSGEERQFSHLKRIFEKMSDGVYVGELLVHGVENRSESNGIINSDDEEAKKKVYMQVWDYISLAEYANPKGKNTTKYEDRYDFLQNQIYMLLQLLHPECKNNVILIESYEVSNISEALQQTAKWMNDGFEGAVLKDYGNVFKDHTSPTQLKLKLEINLEMRVTGFIEGRPGTKREKTFGSLVFENDEGTIKGSTSGFKDDELEEINNNRDSWIGRVIEVQCNDITKASGNNHYALSHPRFIEDRSGEKDTTDTSRTVLWN